VASLVLVAVMIVASFWSIKKLKNVMDKDQANSDK
jgi:CHASE3 domain sensor protein